MSRQKVTRRMFRKQPIILQQELHALTRIVEHVGMSSASECVRRAVHCFDHMYHSQTTPFDDAVVIELRHPVTGQWERSRFPSPTEFRGRVVEQEDRFRMQLEITQQSLGAVSRLSQYVNISSAPSMIAYVVACFSTLLAYIPEGATSFTYREVSPEQKAFLVML